MLTEGKNLESAIINFSAWHYCRIAMGEFKFEFSPSKHADSESSHPALSHEKELRIVSTWFN
ncbi:hypothetical protein [Motilimonas pumila]|nr:hypothetical protein [Motilimonas pumila]